MLFEQHSDLAGAHAFLSPSSYHWINYDIAKLGYRWRALQASLIGVGQHLYAAQEIAAGRFQDGELTTLNLFINDCVRFRMQPEVVLYYSDNCFGTADAIAFRYKILRISDYKSGLTRASVHQLDVYAAIACLEYNIDPYDIRIQLRIYQYGECQLWMGDPEFITYIMNKIIEFDLELDKLRKEEKS